MLLRTAAALDLDRLTARVSDSTTRRSGARLECYRDGSTFVVDIDLPGVDPAGIDISVDGERLTVRAERKHDAPDEPHGSRQFELSDRLDVDRLEARCEDGVVTLQIPVSPN